MRFNINFSKSLLIFFLLSFWFSFNPFIPEVKSQSLFDAIERNNVQDLEKYILNGADVNAINNKGYPPPYLCFKKG